MSRYGLKVPLATCPNRAWVQSSLFYGAIDDVSYVGPVLSFIISPGRNRHYKAADVVRIAVSGLRCVSCHVQLPIRNLRCATYDRRKDRPIVLGFTNSMILAESAIDDPFRWRGSRVGESEGWDGLTCWQFSATYPPMTTLLASTLPPASCSDVPRTSCAQGWWRSPVLLAARWRGW